MIRGMQVEGAIVLGNTMLIEFFVSVVMGRTWRASILWGLAILLYLYPLGGVVMRSGLGTTVIYHFTMTNDGIRVEDSSKLGPLIIRISWLCTYVRNARNNYAAMGGVHVRTPFVDY